MWLRERVAGSHTAALFHSASIRDILERMTPKRFRSIAGIVVVLVEAAVVAFFVWLVFRLGQVSAQ